MKRFWHPDRIIQLVYLLAALVVSLQVLAQGANSERYSTYENYLIFKHSFPHLIQGLNPYGVYMVEQWDLYKYSPAFSLFMAPFAALPDWLGLQLWNLVNAIPLIWAIQRLPILDGRQQRFLALFILPELVVSMQNSQSNGLTLALLLWTWIALERNKPGQAGWWAAAGGFLKIFGIFSAIPGLVYPRRWRLVFSVAAWSVLLLFIPLLVVSPVQLVQVYKWWLELLQDDHSTSVGLSVLGWLETWFGWEASKNGVTLAGLLLLGFSVFAVYRQREPQTGLPPDTGRLLLWASLLIWVVIFNHKAESPTFVIAMSGVALWYQSFKQPPVGIKILLWTAFILASLSPTDLFPRSLREQVVQPYVLKAVPCILIWILITISLLRTLRPQQPSITAHEQ
ncbi:MAG: DUF2029 domain-containing protein [Bacteroidetes bacterium]|nr:MAG: DUF2029 domain-containing protein [Bacteroidota bacterium]